MTTDTPDEQAETNTAPDERPEVTVDLLQQDLSDANERIVRAQADLENFRKRSRRERENVAMYASIDLLRDLLSVVDNLDRAIEASRKEGQSSALLEGVEMVAQMLRDTLKKYQCVQSDALGQPFDPGFHEAVGQEPSDQYDAGTVTRVLRTGYRLHDRDVRPAQVFVSTGPEGGD